MTVKQCVARITADAQACGLTPAQYADRISRATPEEIGAALEQLPTDALEWAVKFEALAHRKPVE